MTQTKIYAVISVFNIRSLGGIDEGPDAEVTLHLTREEAEVQARIEDQEGRPWKGESDDKTNDIDCSEGYTRIEEFILPG